LFAAKKLQEEHAAASTAAGPSASDKKMAAKLAAETEALLYNCAKFELQVRRVLTT
jgi:hypothetical protein